MYPTAALSPAPSQASDWPSKLHRTAASTLACRWKSRQAGRSRATPRIHLPPNQRLRRACFRRLP